jgi:hypothetical protein
MTATKATVLLTAYGEATASGCWLSPRIGSRRARVRSAAELFAAVMDAWADLPASARVLSVSAGPWLAHIAEFSRGLDGDATDAMCGVAWQRLRDCLKHYVALPY